MTTATLDVPGGMPSRIRIGRQAPAAPAAGVALSAANDASAAAARAADTSAERGGQQADPNAVDRELVRRAQRGDTAAFDLLVLKYQHRIAALLRRHLADASELEDVAQETFLRAYRGLDRFRGRSAFYTWLYRIAVNTATNHRIAAGRRPAFRGVDPVDAEHFDDAALLRDTDTPERNAATGEVREAIGRALASMPECLRGALTLREMEGLTYQEIATAMDCPIGTVRSRIARARALIDEFVRPLLDGGEAPARRT